MLIAPIIVLTLVFVVLGTWYVLDLGFRIRDNRARNQYLKEVRKDILKDLTGK